MEFDRAVCDFDLIVEPAVDVPAEQWPSIVADALDVDAETVDVMNVHHLRSTEHDDIGDSGATEIRGVIERRSQSNDNSESSSSS